MTDNEEKILQNAIDIYGVQKQQDQAIEELAELIQAINKHRRKNDQKSFYNLCEEISDVEIMLFQLKKMIKQDNLIENIKSEKIERLRINLLQS